MAKGGIKTDLTIIDKIDPQKAKMVAEKLGVPKEVFMGWLIDERMPKSYIEKMARILNRPFDYFIKGPYEPPQYTRNKKYWEQP